MNLCHNFLMGGLAAIMTMGGAMATEHHDLTGYREGAKVIQVKPVRNQIDSLNGVVYSQVTTLRSVRQLHMSLLVPRTQALKPAIIYFPGGGFTSADHDKFIQMRMALAESGFVVAAAEYRVVPDTFPAPVVDGKAAVRYLRQHAEDYGIDPERIGVLGDSAGGWLAQMLGTTQGETSFDRGDFTDKSSDVQAVATLYGISDLLNIGEGYADDIQKVHQSPAVTEALLVHGAAFRDFAGASIMDDTTRARHASPMGHLSNPKPPFLIMHGDNDSLVSPHQSAQLFDALKKAGEKVDYVVVKGAEHGDLIWYQPAVIDEVVNWFTRELKPETGAVTDTSTDPNSTL
ncbi:alpha/beta hydrolase fold domain-containing protein [Pantoea allii]|uniref:alpha/beta hydrolase fold domain-containing protein n=1 Tax=Pantoea allii TaxID=574096 RepID=UPI003D31E29D